MAYITLEFCDKCQTRTQHVNRNCCTCDVIRKDQIEQEKIKTSLKKT